MQLGRHVGHDWRNVLWKIVSNPALEVLAAIVLVLLVSWMVVSFESEQNHTLYPIPGVHR